MSLLVVWTECIVPAGACPAGRVEALLRRSARCATRWGEGYPEWRSDGLVLVGWPTPRAVVESSVTAARVLELIHKLRSPDDVPAWPDSCGIYPRPLYRPAPRSRRERAITPRSCPPSMPEDARPVHVRSSPVTRSSISLPLSLMVARQARTLSTMPYTSRSTYLTPAIS